MIYKNNDRLREYLHRGAAGAYREHLQHPQFELDATAFAAALEQVRAQHPGLAGGEAEARAVFRLLTSGAPPEITVPLPSLWWRASAFSRRAAHAAWPWLRIAWAIALLLLAATAVLLLGERPAHGAALPRERRISSSGSRSRAASRDASRNASRASSRATSRAVSRFASRNAVAASAVLRSLAARSPRPQFQMVPRTLHPQLGGSSAARVQFLSSGAWTYVSSANPLPMACISGCSGRGGGSGGGTSLVDEAAFTEGTSSFTPAGGYYKSSFTALSSGQSGGVALTANRAFHVTPFSSGGSELFTSGNAAYVQFPSTPTVTVGNASLAVTGTFWQATQPVSWSGQSVTATQATGSNLHVVVDTAPTTAVTGTFWQSTQPVSGTFNATPQSTSTYAAAAFDLAATAATEVKSSGGNVWGWYGFNPNASVCYLQFYNSTSATLGTSALHAFGIAPGASFNLAPDSIALFNLSTGISTGQTTTATGGTQCSSAMTVTIVYE